MSNVGGRLNWLRAGVLGANDGIVSVAGIVIGVAAAGSWPALMTAGVAGLSAGAMSMAVGEYVSVSTQRDTEKALLELERSELAELPEEELTELEGLLTAKGLSSETAKVAARELTAHDALAAHADFELGIDPHELTSPGHAALASAVAFVTGALIPLLTVLLVPHAWAIGLTALAVVVALAITGVVSAKLGRANAVRALMRNVLGGLIAMSVTFAIGRLAGTTL